MVHDTCENSLLNHTVTNDAIINYTLSLEYP